jgi:hypothetical protein
LIALQSAVAFRTVARRVYVARSPRGQEASPCAQPRSRTGAEVRSRKRKKLLALLLLGVFGVSGAVIYWRKETTDSVREEARAIEENLAYAEWLKRSSDRALKQLAARHIKEITRDADDETSQQPKPAPADKKIQANENARDKSEADEARRRTEVEAQAKVEAERRAKEPVPKLAIKRISWNRGDTGAMAKVTLAVENTNNYPVKDIGIRCDFSAKSGTTLARPETIIYDLIKPRITKTFRAINLGPVNPQAYNASCEVVTAARWPN